MSEAPFKVGDKVVAKGTVGSKMTVVHVSERCEQLIAVERDVDGWVFTINPYNYELVPDPMVARREAYIAWASLAWPNGPGGYKEHFDLARAGEIDGAVQQYYDAFVATKHLFV